MHLRSSIKCKWAYQQGLSGSQFYFQSTSTQGFLRNQHHANSSSTHLPGTFFVFFFQKETFWSLKVLFPKEDITFVLPTVETLITKWYVLIWPRIELYRVSQSILLLVDAGCVIAQTPWPSTLEAPKEGATSRWTLASKTGTSSDLWIICFSRSVLWLSN